MKMQIGKWGNSLAVRLPRELVEQFGLKEGDALDSAAIEVALMQTSAATTAELRKAALGELRSRRFDLPPDWKFDRDEANHRDALDKW